MENVFHRKTVFFYYCHFLKLLLSFTWAEPPLPPAAPRGVCRRWALGGKEARAGREGRREMGGRAFAGSWIQSQGSRILLVSLVQVPESRILIQEQASVVGPFPPPTLLPVSSCQPHFSLLSNFHLSLNLFLAEKLHLSPMSLLPFEFLFSHGMLATPKNCQTLRSTHYFDQHYSSTEPHAQVLE